MSNDVSTKNSRIPSSKYKVSRRLMTNIWGHAKDAFEKRKTKPGQHGASSGFRVSDYGVHLKEKQKLKAHYGRIKEKQIRTMMKKAKKQKGNLANNFISLFERKLYVVVYRLNFAPTIFAARQLVSHKHVLVNGKVVNIATYTLSESDKITLSNQASNFSICKDSIKNLSRSIPSYLALDKNSKEGSVVSSNISLDDVPYPFELDMGLVVEFYSR